MVFFSVRELRNGKGLTSFWNFSTIFLLLIFSLFFLLLALLPLFHLQTYINRYITCAIGVIRKPVVNDVHRKWHNCELMSDLFYTFNILRWLRRRWESFFFIYSNAFLYTLIENWLNDIFIEAITFWIYISRRAKINAWPQFFEYSKYNCDVMSKAVKSTSWQKSTTFSVQ